MLHKVRDLLMISTHLTQLTPLPKFGQHFPTDAWGVICKTWYTWITINCNKFYYLLKDVQSYLDFTRLMDKLIHNFIDKCPAIYIVCLNWVAMFLFECVPS